MKTTLPKRNVIRTLILGLVFLFFGTLLSYGQIRVDVEQPSQGFELDGNLAAGSISTNSLKGGDWFPGTTGFGYVFDSSGVNTPEFISLRVTDPFDGSSSDDTIFSGSKFDDSVIDWKLSVGKSTGKGDINNVFFHYSNQDTNQFLFIGADRKETNGSSYIDFAFLQDEVAIDGLSFTTTASSTTGYRSPNDILISMEYNNGGSAASFKLYLWKEISGVWKYVEQPIPGNAKAYGLTNTSVIGTPIGAFNAYSYQPYQFVEAVINISELLQDYTPCKGIKVKTIIVKTKASTALSANLLDVVRPIPVNVNFGTAEISYDNICADDTFAAPQIDGIQDGTFEGSIGLAIDAASGVIDVLNTLPGTYSVIYTFGRCDTKDTTQVTIDKVPVCSIDGPTGRVCPNETALVYSTTDTMNSYLWKVSGNASIVGDTTQNTVTINVGASCDSSYTLSLTVWKNGCSSTCDSIIKVIDQTAPTGTAPFGVSDVDLCAADALSTYTFDAATIAGSYSDNCLGSMIAIPTDTLFINNNCGWTITYTYKVVDQCGNELSGETITYSGSDQTAPTGTTPDGVTGINACASETEIDGLYPTADDEAAIEAAYSDDCGTVSATFVSQNLTGDHCSWELVRTYTVSDGCAANDFDLTMTYSGSDQDAPTGTTPDGVTGINACASETEIDGLY
ncbi:hypothetical protein, partial [Maribellus mangrovi]|uniref:hypothetical protein n=1 Tax=Maribellus mangrovi TaxID=3133146 RepID=UPI0030EBCC74